MKPAATHAAAASKQERNYWCALDGSDMEWNAFFWLAGGRTTCRLTRRAYTPPPLSRGSFFFCGAEPLAPAPLPPSFCQNRATRVSVNLTQSKQVKRQSSSMVATRQRVAAFLRCSGSEKTICCGTLATLVLLASGFSSRAPTLPYSLYVLVLAVRLCSFSNIRRVRGRGPSL